MIQNPPRQHGYDDAKLKTASDGSSSSRGGRSPNISRAPSQVRLAEASNQTADIVSDRATAAFVRRVLCAHHAHNSSLPDGEQGRNTARPIHELLPPLTSSNDVDLQLYGFIAVIVKEFVYAWYAKITPDHAFVDEIIQIIAHCTRALEQRLRKVDLESLLLDEIPELLDAHLTAYRIAHESLHPSPLVRDPRVLYHALHPHPALSPVPLESDPASVLEQQQNEAGWRQLLAQGILAVLLPTEDLESGCLRALVVEIFSEMILGNAVSGKACEGWLLWECIAKTVEVLQSRAASNDIIIIESKQKDITSRLERYGLLSSGEDVSDPVKPKTNASPDALSISAIFWLVIQYLFLAYTAIRAVLMTVATSSSLPSRGASAGSVPSQAEAGRQIPAQAGKAVSTGTDDASANQPIVSMKSWSCISHMLELEERMPWLSGLLSLLRWGALHGPGRVGDTNHSLDRLLSHRFHTTIFNPAQLPSLLRAVRTTLFPANALAPPRVPPTAEEVAAIKRRCAEAIVGAVPEAVARRLFGSGHGSVDGDGDGKREQERWIADLEYRLDALGDAYLNRHLLFAIVETVVLRLMPEVGELGVRELMEMRLG